MKDLEKTTLLARAALLVGMSLLIVAPIMAQTGFEAPPQQIEIEVSDAELESFAGAMGALQEIQFAAQTEVNELVENSTIDTARFNEIHNALNNPEFDMPADITEEERGTYDQVIGTIGEIEREMQADIQDVVVDAGLEVERFNEIAMAVQSDPGLFERLQQHLD